MVVVAPVAHPGKAGRSERYRTMQSIESILGNLDHVQRSGKRWTARCPAHDDPRDSLSISEGNDHRLLLHCHAGCRPEAIVKALGIDMRDLFPPPIPLRIEQTPALQPEDLSPALDIEQQPEEDGDNPWRYAQDAPSFLATQEKEFGGLADELLAPGAITELSAPAGLAKRMHRTRWPSRSRQAGSFEASGSSLCASCSLIGIIQDLSSGKGSVHGVRRTR
jgi:hypothetical protein